MLRLALLGAAVAALFPATATAAADGLIAFTVAEAGLDVVGPEGAGRRPLLREPGAYSPAWSPDGRWVVYSGGELRAVSADGRRVVGLGVTGAAPEWSPDGTRIAFHSGGDVQVAHVTQNLEVLRVDRVTAEDRHRHGLARARGPARVGGAPAPLPALGDGAFDRRTRVSGSLRRRRLTLVNRNRFWVTARVGRRTVRVRPVGRRRVRVGGRVRRIRVLDTAGHRRAIRVRSLSA